MLGSPVTVTPPEGVLISIEEARSFARVDGEDLDGELRLQADAAADDVESVTGLRLLDQRVKVTADRFADLARLNVGPIGAVASIGYRDAAGAAQLVPVEDYELFGAPLEQGIRLVTGASWPTAAAGSIEITLDVGYGASAADVPAKLRYAAFWALRGYFEGSKADITNLVVNHRLNA